MSIRTYFENIASAIKTKNSEVATVTPAQMPQAILDIPSGGGIQLEDPLHYDFTGGYVYNGNFEMTSDPVYNDCYLLKSNHKYIITLGSTMGNRFRCMLSTTDTYGALSKVYGTSVGIDISNPTFDNSMRKFITSNALYFTVMKTNAGQQNVKTYVIDITDWS